MSPEHLDAQLNVACWTCGKPGQIGGLFMPNLDAARQMGAPPGKAMVLAYRLCMKCSLKAGIQREVESKFLRYFREMHRKNETN